MFLNNFTRPRTRIGAGEMASGKRLAAMFSNDHSTAVTAIVWFVGLWVFHVVKVVAFLTGAIEAFGAEVVGQFAFAQSQMAVGAPQFVSGGTNHEDCFVIA